MYIYLYNSIVSQRIFVRVDTRKYDDDYRLPFPATSSINLWQASVEHRSQQISWWEHTQILVYQVNGNWLCIKHPHLSCY